MKRLYLYFLNLRVWLVHRRLREMGFRHLLDEADARTLLQLAKDSFDEEKVMLDWIKIGLTVVVILSMWLMFFWRLIEPIQVHINLPPPSPPDAITPPAHPFSTYNPQPQLPNL